MSEDKDIVLVGVYGKGSNSKHVHLLPAPGASAYYRIPKSKAKLEPAEPDVDQAVTVTIKDPKTEIECVQTVAANFLRGPIAGAHLHLATTVGRLAAAVGNAELLMSGGVTDCPPG